MELTRRDAVVALAGVAGVTAAGTVADRLDEAEPDDERLERVREGLSAATDVVYPTVVTVDDEFLETYVLGRSVDEADYLAAVGGALRTLDRLSVDRFGAGFTDLSPTHREQVLLDAGVASVTPDPAGAAVERVRYYVVEELLYALYTSPTGGELVGNENPPGYPGGREAYQRGPDDA